MEHVEVEITGMAMTNRYGTLTTGAILRTDSAFAKHLVEECGCAKYREPATTEPVTPARKPRKKSAAAAPVENAADAVQVATESTDEAATESTVQADSPAE